MTFTIQHRSALRFQDLTITFQRTLRIPDDGKRYPLPPGLGALPVRAVADYADRVPAEWRAKGGVMIPLYRREAMWLSFSGPHWKPFALKVGVGKVCAITGLPWSDALRSSPQDYVVTPPQPWLDGIHNGPGSIRQFIAMPLGQGYTVEGQVTGEETVGGLQLRAFAPRPGIFQPPPPRAVRRRVMPSAGGGGGVFGGAPGGMPMPCAPMAAPAPAPRSAGMGIAAGGKMKQKIYPDPHGVSTWDTQSASRLFVHIVDAMHWTEITGEPAPATPVTAKTYAQHGLPWFDVYDDHLPAHTAPGALKGVKSVKEIDGELSGQPLQDDEPVPTTFVKKVLDALDGKW